MSGPVIVVHYHELWLKGGNRRFFLGKLFTALRQSLQGVPLFRIEQPGDRFMIRLRPEASLTEALARVDRVLGVAYYAVARPAERAMEAICQAAWDEIAPLHFSTFAIRAKRSDKTFPHPVMEIERTVGRHVVDKLSAERRESRVQLKDPEVTCRIEVTPGPVLVYAKKFPGLGDFPQIRLGK